VFGENLIHRIFRSRNLDRLKNTVTILDRSRNNVKMLSSCYVLLFYIDKILAPLISNRVNKS
jgi:hypothetical protein